jgi:hypothetical protein
VSALARFAQRQLTEPYPHLILDARYEKVHLDGVIQSQAALVALGINWDGRRQAGSLAGSPCAYFADRVSTPTSVVPFFFASMTPAALPST